MEPSVVKFYDKDLSKLSKLIFVVFRAFRFIKVTEKVEIDDKNKNKKTVCFESSNFTIINFYLTLVGPLREDKLTVHLLILQV